jgi:hypothetical protein
MKQFVVLVLLAVTIYGIVIYFNYIEQQRRANQSIIDAGNSGNAIAHVLGDPQMRLLIHGQALKIMPNDGARCAAVQSCTYFAAKGKDITKLGRCDVWTGTADFEAHLRKNGWHEVCSLDALEPGMICFSQDRRGRKGAADHVYTFCGWLERRKRVALIWDNYQAALHPRNMLGATLYWWRRYNNTPFAFALAPPVQIQGGG